MAREDETNSKNRDAEVPGEKVQVARITALQAIVVAFIAVIGSGVTGFTGYLIAKQSNKPSATTANPTVVPPPVDLKTVPKLEESGEGFQTLRDVSIFDLRGWKQLSLSENNLRASPVNYINYLHVTRTSQAKLYRAHYATTGTAIDLRCITHPADVLLQATPVEHAGGKVKEYAVEVNVENAPVDKEFLIVIEGTYWNSFQDIVEESASTYTDKDIKHLQELALFILLPENKPFKGYKLWSHPTGHAEKKEYQELTKFYADKDGRFIFWSILDRRSDYHYEVTWNW